MGKEVREISRFLVALPREVPPPLRLSGTQQHTYPKMSTAQYVVTCLWQTQSLWLQNYVGSEGQIRREHSSAAAFHIVLYTNQSQDGGCLPN